MPKHPPGFGSTFVSPCRHIPSITAPAFQRPQPNFAVFWSQPRGALTMTSVTNPELPNSHRNARGNLYTLTYPDSPVRWLHEPVNHKQHKATMFLQISVSPAIDPNLSSCSRRYPHILSHSNKLLPNPPHAYLIALSLSMAIFSRFITCSIKAIDLSHIPLPPSQLPLSPHSAQ